MICNNFFECVTTACTEKKKKEQAKDTRTKKSDRKKTKESEKEKTSEEIWVSPCKDSSQQCKCVEYADTRSMPSCKEQGKSYVYDQSELTNKQVVVCTHIDDGVVNGAEAKKISKCDYAFFVKNASVADSLEKAILVELKGSDVNHALEQLKGTLGIKEFKDVWTHGCPVYGRVVCSRVPGIVYSDSVIKEKKEWQKRYNGSLKVESNGNMVDNFNDM